MNALPNSAPPRDHPDDHRADAWSIAGVVTRHLSPELQAQGRFEITFWRSVFAAIFVGGFLLARRDFVGSLRRAPESPD